MLLARIYFISPRIVELLGQQNIKTVEDLIFADRKLIAERIKVDLKELESIVSFLEQQYSPIPNNASLLLSETVTKDAALFSTGSDGIDKVLGGGVFTGHLIELAGGPATGKTQLCMCMSLLAALDGASVVYIDSSNTFSPERLMEMYVARKLAGKEERLQIPGEKKQFESTLSQIRCYKAFNVFTLMEILENMERSLGEESIEGNKTPTTVFFSKLRVIIVDSIASLIGPLLGKQQPNLGPALMTTVSRSLKFLATKHNIAVVVTNYTVAGDDMKGKKAGLGQSWSYVPTTQLFLHHDLVEQLRYAVVTKCPHTAFFKITELGMSNA